MIYLCVCVDTLAWMAIETVRGQAGTGSMFAAFLSVPWSMLMASFAPALPAHWPLAAGLALRIGLLAVFMLLNSAIVASIMGRGAAQDVSNRAAKAVAIAVLPLLVLSSGCGLLSSQRLLVADGTVRSQLFNGGGTVGYVYAFDLSNVPAWRDHRAKLQGATDLTLMGTFTGGASATDLEAFFLTDPLAIPSDLFNGTSPQVWGPLHLEAQEQRRVDWNEGSRRLGPDRDALRRAVLGDGMVTLFVRLGRPAAPGGEPTIRNLHLGALLEVK